MYGCHPNLPTDIEFGVQTPDISGTSTHKYIQKLQTRLKWVYKKAEEVNTCVRAQHKKLYDRK